MSTVREFVGYVTRGRENMSFSDFLEGLGEYSQFESIVGIIAKNNEAWQAKIGPVVKTGEVYKLNEKELRWKAFFRDHSFNSTGEARTFADAFSIVEGIDLLRFLRVENEGTNGKFPAYIALVPTGNGNSHNYKIGEPILSFSRGSTFYRITGSGGNAMSGDTNDYRMADVSEIKIIVSSLLYRLSGSLDTFVSSFESRL